MRQRRHSVFLQTTGPQGADPHRLDDQAISAREINVGDRAATFGARVGSMKFLARPKSESVMNRKVSSPVDPKDWSDNGEPSRSIREWCELEGIATCTFHQLRRKGQGPVVMRLGRLVRVVEGRKSYHERMLKIAEGEAERREQDRRREQASRAGKAAIASDRHPINRKRRERLDV
jgi:hypothetical protein